MREEFECKIRELLGYKADGSLLRIDDRCNEIVEEIRAAIEEMFDIIECVHHKLGHKNEKAMEVKLKRKYSNTAREKKTKGKGVVVISLVMSELNSQYQVGLIDMQSEPDGDYTFIANYQDHLTQFVVLRLLKTMSTDEVADIILDIFNVVTMDVNFVIRHDDKALVAKWNGIKLVHGRSCPSESQGSVERAKQDIRDSLVAWMKYKNSASWDSGLRIVQSSKNFSYHSGIKRTPSKKEYPAPNVLNTFIRHALQQHCPKFRYVIFVQINWLLRPLANTANVDYTNKMRRCFRLMGRSFHPPLLASHQLRWQATVVLKHAVHKRGNPEMCVGERCLDESGLLDTQLGKEIHEVDDCLQNSSVQSVTFVSLPAWPYVSPHVPDIKAGSADYEAAVVVEKLRHEVIETLEDGLQLLVVRDRKKKEEMKAEEEETRAEIMANVRQASEEISSRSEKQTTEISEQIEGELKRRQRRFFWGREMRDDNAPIELTSHVSSVTHVWLNRRLISKSLCVRVAVFPQKLVLETQKMPSMKRHIVAITWHRYTA
ncbi:hypothetical protein PR048_027018 [Dryococelus australis]|uniref:Uncharacterized protein n=1 Tax=Dryococelus australis TaxID=614101 RepID=A0ABQ9GMZ6_9NEOP|nr:hypothetical protein PR048_027018 [Dryococelus australis]